MATMEDLELLAHLRKNARSKLTRISRETGMPVSTMFDKLKGTLAGCIKRYTCILNNSKLGFSSRATVIIKVDKEQKEELGQLLQKHQNVNSLYRINNGYDFMLDAIFREMKDLEEFIEQIEAKYRIRHKEVYFVIDELKQEGFLTEPQAVKLLSEKQPAKEQEKIEWKPKRKGSNQKA